MASGRAHDAEACGEATDPPAAPALLPRPRLFAVVAAAVLLATALAGHSRGRLLLGALSLETASEPGSVVQGSAAPDAGQLLVEDGLPPWRQLRGTVQGVPSERSLEETSDACYMGGSETCPLSSMARDRSVMVYPGGKTRCLYSYSTDYAFQVIPGDSDKLLIHFQGGGVCWDNFTTFGIYGSLCSDSAYEERMNGIFNRNSTHTPESPFLNYTVVVVTYCSGDLHVGDAVRPYKDRAGFPVEQRGFWNAQAAVSWAFENAGTGLERLVISGSSAGALGVQLWASRLLRSFQYQYGAVVTDSFVGALPNATQGPLLAGFNFCSDGVLRRLFPGRAPMCDGIGEVVTDLFDATMKQFPQVTFASVNSKEDLVQVSFHNSVAMSFKQPFNVNMKFNQVLNSVLVRLNANRNFVAYVIPGYQHTFLPLRLLYNADTASPFGHNRPPRDDQLKLHDWVRKLPLMPDDSIAAQCSGCQANATTWCDTCNCVFFCDWMVSHKVVVA